MRYFRRSGPTVVLQESQTRNPRLVKAPTETEGGTIVAYDDTWPDEKQWAEQMSHTPGYYECDATGQPTIYLPPPVPPAAPIVEDDPVTIEDTGTTV